MMATLPQRLWTSNQCGHQSPEFAILFNDQNPHTLTSTLIQIVKSECTALLGRRLGYGGVSDSGFSLCTVPTYYCGSEYFWNCCPQVQNLIGTECSLNRSEHSVKSKAS